MEQPWPWDAPLSFDRFDRASVNEENDRLRRLLCVTTKDNLRTKKELKLAREALGHNKPFKFLKLPAEVRNQIYREALCAPKSVKTHPVYPLSLDENPRKPPIPAIICVSKQIYKESIEFLYSENTFSFENPDDFLIFESQIGRNRALVRKLKLSMGPEHIWTPNAEQLAPCDLQAVPSHWAVALSKSRSGLSNIVKVTIKGGGSSLWDPKPMLMGAALQAAVVSLFSRSQEDSKRTLILKGFRDIEKMKFPDDWDIQVQPTRRFTST